MHRGEIWTVLLPFASGGREQGGQRPALVIQDEAYGLHSPLVLIVPLTSQLAAARFPAAVTIAPSAGNGLTHDSVAMVFQTRALDRSRFVRQVGQLSDADLDLVLSQLNKLTGQATIESP